MPQSRRLPRAQGPAARRRISQFLHLDHVREYNKSYNYFAGMADDDIADYQRSASIGHRPTWNVGVNRDGTRAGARQSWTEAFADPFGFFGGSLHAARRRSRTAAPAARQFRAPVLRGARSGRHRERHARSRPATKNSSNACIPTPMAATAASRTGCEKSSKPITTSNPPASADKPARAAQASSWPATNGFPNSPPSSYIKRAKSAGFAPRFSAITAPLATLEPKAPVGATGE